MHSCTLRRSLRLRRLRYFEWIDLLTALSCRRHSAFLCPSQVSIITVAVYFSEALLLSTKTFSYPVYEMVSEDIYTWIIGLRAHLLICAWMCFVVWRTALWALADVVRPSQSWEGLIKYWQISSVGSNTCLADALECKQTSFYGFPSCFWSPAIVLKNVLVRVIDFFVF